MQYRIVSIVVLIVCSLVPISAVRAHGALPHVQAATVAASPSATPTPAANEYVLPYPGLLPTHPLYFIKEFRDKVVEMLISDPVSKGEFHVLQADKKLNMALALKTLGKGKETGEALVDAKNSRFQAVSTLEAYKKTGNDVPGHVIEKLGRSVIKHEEVLVSMGENPESIRSLAGRVAALRGE